MITFVGSRRRSRREFALCPRPGHPAGKIGGANGEEGQQKVDTLPVLHPDVAGIDVGASALYVIGADRDPQPIRNSPPFNRDLHALADWLEQCGILSFAMEPTSEAWDSWAQEFRRLSSETASAKR
jgi:hypothetical protein